MPLAPPQTNAPQAIAEARRTTVHEMLKPITKAFESILERRLLPIRSIAAQVGGQAGGVCLLRG